MTSRSFWALMLIAGLVSLAVQGLVIYTSIRLALVHDRAAKVWKAKADVELAKPTTVKVADEQRAKPQEEKPPNRRLIPW